MKSASGNAGWGMKDSFWVERVPVYDPNGSKDGGISLGTK